MDIKDHYLENITALEKSLVENFTRDSSKFTSNEYSPDNKNNFNSISSNWSNSAYTIQIIGNY